MNERRTAHLAMLPLKLRSVQDLKDQNLAAIMAQELEERKWPRLSFGSPWLHVGQ